MAGRPETGGGEIGGSFGIFAQIAPRAIIRGDMKYTEYFRTLLSQNRYFALVLVASFDEC